MKQKRPSFCPEHATIIIAEHVLLSLLMLCRRSLCPVVNCWALTKHPRKLLLDPLHAYPLREAAVTFSACMQPLCPVVLHELNQQHTGLVSILEKQ